MNRQIQTGSAVQHRTPAWWRLMSVIVVALVFGVLMQATLLWAAPVAAPAAANLTQSAPDHGGDDGDSIIKYGVLVTRSDEIPSTWVISNTTLTEYSVTGDTEFEGELTVGRCVAVKSTTDEPNVAQKIRAVGPGDCDHEDPNPGGDEIIRFVGLVMARPVESAGTWVIDEKEYAVTDSTELIGSLEVGACVEVKSRESAPNVAIRIGTKEASACDDDDEHHEDGDFTRRYGIVMTRPVESLGTWVISGTEYIVTDRTVLEGNLQTGACVEVKVLTSEPSIAWKIEAKDADKCNGDDDDDDDGEHHGDGDIERYGRLESQPDGRVGVWVIDGKSYTATESTEFHQEYGQLVVGVCTKVHLLEDEPTVAREIESVKDYKCSGREHEDDDDARGLLFGVIEALPVDVNNGIWEIGGLSFVVSPTTEIITKGSAITVGLTVKVNFTTNMSDTNFADRIEVKFGEGSPCRRHNDLFLGPNRDGGSDDDRDYGFCPGHEGKTYGIIDSRPEGSLIGDWMIGGVPYITTASTKFHADDDFLAGERVKVEYVVLSDNMRRITQIKESDDNGGVSNPNHSLIVGYVDAKPDAFVGPWTINGAPFVALSTTVFIERGSLFAVGAYVVVEYEIVNDQREIIKILTYVPPGAGDEDKVGQLESVDGLSVTGTETPQQSAEVWTVDGVDYIVSAATQLVDSGGELVPGAVVYVNSYTADGQRYATMIRTQGGKAFIPMAVR